MDPADPMYQAVSSQGTLLGQHDRLLRALVDSNQSVSAHISELSRQVSSLAASVQDSRPPSQPEVAPTSSASRDIHVSDPDPFSGDLEKCRGFLLQCGLVFLQRPLSFSTDSAKINYSIGLFRGRALAWAEALSTDGGFFRMTYDDFVTRLRTVFDHPNSAGNASNQLLKLRQGNRSVADYSVDFWTLAAEAQWNDAALRAAFTEGLSDKLKDELAARDVPSDLSALVSLSIMIDNRLCEGQRERTSRGQLAAPPARLFLPPVRRAFQSDQPPAHPAEEEPMLLGRAKLTAEERLRRIRAGECLYCGKSGHYVNTCPSRPKGGAHQ